MSGRHSRLRSATPVATSQSGLQPASPSSALPGRLGRGVMVNYSTVLLTGAATLVTTRILLDHLGAQQYGVFVLAGSVVGYLELLELGFGTATTKMLAEDVDRRNESVLRTLNTNVAVLMVLGVIAAVAGVALSGFAPGWFGIPPSLAGQAHVAFAIMAVAIAVSIPFDTLGGALNAYGRIDLLSVSNLARALSAAIGGAIAAVLGGGVVAVTTVGAACGVATHLIRWRMLSRLLPGLRLSPGLVDRSRLKTTTHLSGWFMLRDATAVVVERLDLAVVGVVLGVRAAAVYAIGLKLAQLGLRAVQPFTQLFFPRASGLSADGDRDGLAALLVDGTRVTLAVALPIMLGLSLLAPAAITAWVGHGFNQAIGVLVFLAIGRGLAALTETAWWILGGAGWVRWTSSLSLVEAGVNLSSSIVLAHIMGPSGVALGTLIGVVVARLPVAFLLAERATGVRPLDMAKGALVPHLAPVVVTTAALVMARFVVPASPVAVLAAAVGCFALYGAVYVGLGASTSERDRVRTLLRLTPRSSAAAAPTIVAPREPVERLVTEVAVCICTYHRPAGLARLLDALPAAVPVGEVAGVGDVRVRIVVVDNEVNERNEAIVAAAADRLPWPVTYVPEPARGISYARNTAVRHALPDADFVAFVDDDEVPEPGWLTALLQTQRSTGADVVMGPQDTVYDEEPPRWVRRGGFFRPREFAEAEPLHWATTANVLIAADLFAIADPPFSERLALAGGEDTHFFRRAHLSGARIVWTGTARVREHVPSNRTTARWLVQREYRRGNTLGICLVDLEDSAYRRFRRVVRAALSVARGAALATTAVVSGRAGLVRGAQAVGFGAGLLTGMWGHVYDEYADDSRYEVPSAEPVG